jgi:hypothetical protein
VRRTAEQGPQIFALVAAPRTRGPWPVSATAVTGATTAFGSPRERPAPASVTGSATFRLPYQEDADIRSLTFDAHAAPYSRPIPGLPGGLPTDAHGTVKGNGRSKCCSRAR